MLAALNQDYSSKEQAAFYKANNANLKMGIDNNNGGSNSYAGPDLIT